MALHLITGHGMAGYGVSPPTRVLEAAGTRPLGDRVFRPLLAAERREAA